MTLCNSLIHRPNPIPNIVVNGKHFPIYGTRHFTVPKPWVWLGDEVGHYLTINTSVDTCTDNNIAYGRERNEGVLGRDRLVATDAHTRGSGLVHPHCVIDALLNVNVYMYVMEIT